MGNSPSTSKPGSQSSSYQSNAQNESPRPVRRDNKHPIPVHDRRVAAPPEPSLTQAQGTAVQPPPSSSSNRSNPLQHRPVALASGNSTPSTTDAAVVSSTPIPTRPIEGKQGTPSPSPEPAKPVDVPYPHNSPSSPRSPRSPTSDDTYEPFTMPHSSLQDISYLTRPPRLPLRIEEEVYTPGSPIISPADIGQPLDDVDELFDNSGLARPLSTLSNNDAADEYEEEDDLEGLLVDKTGPRVPTTLEWRHGGEKIYITGSMYQWGRKTRLRPVEGRVGVYAATVPCNPGTHHIRFLVDGNMKISPDYPQAVDTTNTLVNYIEVSSDGLKNSPKPAESDATSQATKERTKAVEEGEGSDAGQETEQKRPKYREVPLASLFEHKIPKYLLDFDQPEDTPPYHSACSAIEKLSNPPALPGFLGKPILNAASLIKDDNSVLNMPNHTVLNHLATSSIKNNILAVSATTRYKNKYITTIMYKPTTTEGI